MGFRLEVVFFIIAVCVFLALFLGMRRGAVRGGSVALWIVVSLAMVSTPLIESHYVSMAEFLGISYARDMLNMFAIIFLLVYVFYLTAKLQKTSDMVEILLSRAAIAEYRLKTTVAGISEQPLSPQCSTAPVELAGVNPPEVVVNGSGLSSQGENV